MLGLVKVAVLLCLLLIAWQDFKWRAVSWIWIVLAFIGFVFIAIQQIDVKLEIKYLLINNSFISIQLIILTLYMSLKNKKIINIVNQYLGLGDILFFVVMAAAFSPIHFILFYLASTVITLLGYVIYKLVKKTNAEIPLAGSMATLLSILMLLNFYFENINFYNDDFFISYLTN
jgi:hypothetical protein